MLVMFDSENAQAMISLVFVCDIREDLPQLVQLQVSLFVDF